MSVVRLDQQAVFFFFMVTPVELGVCSDANPEHQPGLDVSRKTNPSNEPLAWEATILDRFCYLFIFSCFYVTFGWSFLILKLPL